jgi:hypothetical protein
LARVPKHLKKKIASLSALGAGTLVFGVTKAEAGIVYSGVINSHVGFSSGGTPNYLSNPMGTGGATFSFFRTSRVLSSVATRAIGAYGCGCLVLAQQGGLLQLFNAGATWGQAAGTGTSLLVGGRQWGVFGSFPATTYSSGRPAVPFANSFGNLPFSDMYAQFTFTDFSGSFYGWIHLSYTVSGSFGTDPSLGPDLVLRDYAYEDTGALIAAGDTGVNTGVPEPGTLASTGLAALALGATGLRKWRKNRKAA